MPLLTDFLQPVYNITNRPDLVTETTAFLNRALQKVHFASEYRFDLQTLVVPYAGSQELSEALPARFRKIYQVVVPDNGNRYKLDEVTPAALFDDDVLMRKLNTYYLAGSQINFNLGSSFLNINVMYLQTPLFADSFIATQFPDIITYLAAAYIFMLMKNQPKASQWASLANDIEVELQRNYFAV